MRHKTEDIRGCPGDGKEVSDIAAEEKLRSFIAIECSHKLQAEIGAIQQKLKALAPEVKWVEPGNIHLTLKFLGGITPAQIEEIKKVIGDLARKTEPFDCRVASLGAFPKPEYPRVIWVGVKEGKEKVGKVFQELEERLAQIGFAKDVHPFHPHLTLGRVKFLKDKKALVQSIKSLDFEAENRLTVGKITLMQSTLTPKGPIYTPLHQATLQKCQPPSAS